MADYNIKLGVNLDTSNLSSQINSTINAASKNAKPIKIDIDTKDLAADIKAIRQQLESLTKNTYGEDLLKIDTHNVEKNIENVRNFIWGLHDTVDDIKEAFGALDKDSGMKNLLESINSISSALEKVSGQFDEIVADMKSISSKDFNINFGINTGGSNQIQRNALYGQKVKNEIVPQLKEQAKALESYFEQYYNVSGGYSAIAKLMRGSGNSGLDFANILTGLENTKASPKEQLQKWQDYVNLIQKVANLKGIDISGVTSGFSKSADQLVQDAQKIQTGVNEATESTEKLKSIFNSGINAEKLDQQLDSIVTSLKDIQEAINGLQGNVSIDGLSTSFQDLSNTLKELISNTTLMKDSLNSGLSGAGTSINGVAQQFKEADIVVRNSEDSIENLKDGLRDIGFNSSAVDSITKDFDDLGVKVTNVTSKLREDGSVTLTVKGVDQMERAVTVMKNFRTDAEGNFETLDLGTSISQDFNEVENAYKRLLSITKEMGNIQVKLNGLDPDKDAAQIDTLVARLETLGNEYNDLYQITNKNLSGNQIEKLNQEAANSANKLAEAQAKLSDTSSTEAQTNAYKQLLSVQKEINSTEINISKLHGQSGKDGEISTLNDQLLSLKKTYSELENELSKPLSASQMDNLQKEIDETDKKLEQLNERIADKTVNNANSLLSASSITGASKGYTNVESSFNRLSNASDDTRNALGKLEESYDSLRSAQEEYRAASEKYTANESAKVEAAEKLINANKEYQNTLKATNNLIAEDNRKQQDAFDATKLEQAKESLSLKMTQWLNDNSAAADQFGGRVQELIAQIQSCDRQGLEHLKGEFANVQKEAELAGKTGQSLGDRLKAQFQRFSTYLSVASVFMYATQAMKDMYQQVLSIDTAMTELKKVTDETSSSYSKFLTDAASKASDIGTTIDGLVTSTADFARLGYGFKDAQGLAEVANIYTVVGDEIEGVDEATQSLVSTMAAFKDETSNISDTDFAMDIIDKFNEVEITCLLVW